MYNTYIGTIITSHINHTIYTTHQRKVYTHTTIQDIVLIVIIRSHHILHIYTSSVYTHILLQYMAYSTHHLSLVRTIYHIIVYPCYNAETGKMSTVAMSKPVLEAATIGRLSHQSTYKSADCPRTSDRRHATAMDILPVSTL